MLNTFEFPEAKQIFPAALRAAKNIAKLKQKAREHRAAVIYVNDNFGHWQSDWKALYEICTEEKCLGKPIAEILRPEPEDYFVLKPKHSGFYASSLEVLLDQLQTERLIIVGIAGNICVLFTAHDAHMREYEVIVPRDCVASNTDKENQFALKQLEHVFGIKTKKAGVFTPA
jgi:nicotinamidase-related amidase